MNKETAPYSYLIVTLLVILWGIHFIPLLSEKSRMWGFNHLIFLPLPVIISFVLIGISVLALTLLPCSRSWDQNLTSWFSRIFFESRQKYLYRSIFAAVCGIIFLLFPMPTHFLGDGYQYLNNIASESGTFVKWSEKGITYILLAVQALLGTKDLHSALMAFRTVSVASGIAAIWLYFLIAQESISGPIGRLLIFATLTFSGSLLLFFGYVENYPLLWIAVPGLIYFCLRYLKGKSGLLGALIFLLFGIFIHLLTAIFLPAVIYVIFSVGRGKILFQKFRMAFIAAGSVFILAIIYLFIRQYSTNLYFENIFLPLFTGKPIDPAYAILSSSHIIDMINLLFLLYPLLPLFVVVGLSEFRTMASKPPGMFLLLAALGGLAFLLVIDPGLTMPRDWDLFSLSGLALILFLLTNSRYDSDRNLMRIPIIPVIAVTILSSVPYVMVNLNGPSSARYVENFVSNDMSKSMGTLITLREYFKEQGDMTLADSVNDVINSKFGNFNLMRDAMTAIQRGDLNRAGQIINRIAPDKFSKNYHRLMAFYHLLEKKPGLAAQEARKAIQVQPYSYDSYLLLSSCFQIQGEYDSALAVLQVAYQLNNRSLPILTALADISLFQRNFESALIYSSKIIEMDSLNANGLYFLTKSYFGEGRTEDARKYAGKYLTYEARDPLFETRKKELHELLGR
ncbi:membrane hypothetical protein [Candidatus Zixiibacteriota bacterium]|nr:membrane hypothetical protein [candidate division Zixibacteria bacterium]